MDSSVHPETNVTFNERFSRTYELDVLASTHDSYFGRVSDNDHADLNRSPI